jgi:hypothetical protein
MEGAPQEGASNGGTQGGGGAARRVLPARTRGWAGVIPNRSERGGARSDGGGPAPEASTPTRCPHHNGLSSPSRTGRPSLADGCVAA